MRVLVTGDHGMIGRAVAAHLRELGDVVVGFDRVAGCDVLDRPLLAVASALRCPDPGHRRLLLCAEDISSARLTTRELVAMLLPHVVWRGGPEFERQPYRALLDIRGAREVLGWAPRHRWRNRVEI